MALGAGTLRNMQRNLAGDLVGADRPCRRRDGTPKKVYTDAEALAWHEAHGGGRYALYKCARDHWHIGNKLRRPIVSYDRV